MQEGLLIKLHLGHLQAQPLVVLKTLLLLRDRPPGRSVGKPLLAMPEGQALIKLHSGRFQLQPLLVLEVPMGRLPVQPLPTEQPCPLRLQLLGSVLQVPKLHTTDLRV